MKVKDIIKKQTTLIAVAVIVVVVAAIGVSYSIFFAVEAGNTQVITAGALKLKISDISALDLSVPKTNANGLTSTPVTYTVQNTDSNLPAMYSIYVYAGADNGITLDKIKLSTDGSTYKAISSITETLVESGVTYYKIESGTVAAKSSLAAKSLRLWVDEDLLTSDVEGKKVDLSLYIVSEVQE